MTALAYLHDLRVLHRDLKPSNILLVHTPQGLDVRLTDFGIAKVSRGARVAGEKSEAKVLKAEQRIRLRQEDE